MSNNPFAPKAPEATEAAEAATEMDETETTGTSKPKRERKAKAMTVEQHKEIIVRSKNGETPKVVADAMGIERNQAYNFVRKYKKIMQSVIDNEESSAEQKAKAQAELDAFPVREFGATAGEKRVSSSAVAINDLLAEAGIEI